MRKKKIKENIFKKHGKSSKNTGSAEGQIALFTHRINHLTEHLKSNRKDFNTERSLVKLVGKRRSLLDYLMKKDILTSNDSIRYLISSSLVDLILNWSLEVIILKVNSLNAAEKPLLITLSLLKLALYGSEI